jgi:hypothetical protein
MNRITKQSLVLIAGFAFLAAGCGSGRAGQGVPTAGGTGTTAANTSGADLDQALVNYVHCMRGHGVTISDPSPRPGHTGLTLTPPDMSIPGVAQADGQCQHFLAPIEAAKSAGARARTTPTVMSALLNYARCMRSHDIPLLDPSGPDGHISLGNVPGINNPIGRQDPQFQSADATCRHFLPSSVPDDGTGPS